MFKIISQIFYVYLEDKGVNFQFYAVNAYLNLMH